MCGNSYSKWHSNRLDCNQTALLRCQEHRCCLSKIFKTESKTSKNPQWGAQGKFSVAFLTQGNFSLLFTALSGAGDREPYVSQPSDSSGRARWEAKAGQPGQGSADTRCPLCTGHGTGEGLLHAFGAAPANGFLPWLLREGLACMWEREGRVWKQPSRL